MDFCKVSNYLTQTYAIASDGELLSSADVDGENFGFEDADV